MADKESFAVRLMHAIDSMLAPKDESGSPDEETMARRQQAEMAMNRPPRPRIDPTAGDDIGNQVDALRRRRKVFSLGTSDEPDL